MNPRVCAATRRGEPLFGSTRANAGAAPAAISFAVNPCSFCALLAVTARLASGTTPVATAPAVPPNARKSAIVATARAGLGRLIHFAFMLTSSQRLEVEAGASVGCQEARTERSSHAHTVLTQTQPRPPSPTPTCSYPHRRR